MKTAADHFNSNSILHLLSALLRGKAVALQPCCSVHGWRPGERERTPGSPVWIGGIPVPSGRSSQR